MSDGPNNNQRRATLFSDLWNKYIERARFANAEGFNITEQLPEDVMHVLLEGIAPIHIGLFLKELLINNPALSVEAFNHKVKSFSYRRSGFNCVI